MCIQKQRYRPSIALRNRNRNAHAKSILGVKNLTENNGRMMLHCQPPQRIQVYKRGSPNSGDSNYLQRGTLNAMYNWSESATMERGTVRRQQTSSCQERACKREKQEARLVNKKKLSNVPQGEEEGDTD